MQDMTPEELRHFLLGTARTGKLSTVCKDGRPHVAPIWFDMDGDALIFTTAHASVKGRNIQRDPRLMICVDEETPPFAYVLYEGRAEVMSPTPEEFLRWATSIAGRYMGADQAEAYGRRNAVPGELLIRVTPTKIVAQKGISDW